MRMCNWCSCRYSRRLAPGLPQAAGLLVPPAPMAKVPESAGSDGPPAEVAFSSALYRPAGSESGRVMVKVAVEPGAVLDANCTLARATVAVCSALASPSKKSDNSKPVAVVASLASG